MHQPCVCSKGAIHPSPTHSLPSPMYPSLFVFNTPLLVRGKQKTHKTLFFILFPKKWANSQLQSLGEFPAWESGNCQEWKAAASQWGLCCRWPKQQQKQPQPPPPPQQNTPRVHKHTQTRPQNQPNGQGFKEKLLGCTFGQQGLSVGTRPRQPSSQPPTICHQHSAYCKCADTVQGGQPVANGGEEQTKPPQSAGEGGYGFDTNWQKAGKFKLKSLPWRSSAVRAGLWEGRGVWPEGDWQSAEAGALQLTRPALPSPCEQETWWRIRSHCLWIAQLGFLLQEKGNSKKKKKKQNLFSNKVSEGNV